MDNMCAVIAYFYAKPEKLHELEKILQEFVVRTRQEPGCIDYHLHQADDDPNVFVFYETGERAAIGISITKNPF